jgi:hypothetical protein
MDAAAGVDAAVLALWPAAARSCGNGRRSGTLRVVARDPAGNRISRRLR